jgi:hypothetical protein
MRTWWFGLVFAVLAGAQLSHAVAAVPIVPIPVTPVKATASAIGFNAATYHRRAESRAERTGKPAEKTVQRERKGRSVIRASSISAGKELSNPRKVRRLSKGSRTALAEDARVAPKRVEKRSGRVRRRH